MPSHQAVVFFGKHVSESRRRQWFFKRKYPILLIDEQIEKAKSAVPRVQNVQTEPPKESLTPLVVTYHPALSGIGHIMRKHFHVLEAHTRAKEVFQRPPMVSYRNPKTIKQSLVRAKLSAPTASKGCFKCKKPRCKVCHNMTETSEFVSFQTGHTYKINFELNCSSTCVIYLMNCKVCGKQLTGECTTEFRERWNNYMDNMRKALRNENHFQSVIHSHFMSPGHTSMKEDVSIILIDKTDSFYPKNREKFWIDRLCTLSPYGINTSETM